MAFEEEGAALGTADGQALFERFLCLNGPVFYGFLAAEQRFQMENTPSEIAVLQTPASPVTPLPTGMGIDLTWRI